MLKRLVLIGLLLIQPFGISNGYYQTTRIEFEGLKGTCYATLLSNKTVSGTWDAKLELDLNAPEKVIEFFKNYEDSQRYYYLNYFQDVSEGLLYWPFYPPEQFKLLIYYPDSDTYITSEATQRYALNSTYKAIVNDNGVTLVSNYNYFKMIFNTILRIVIFSLISIFVTVFIAKPSKIEIKYAVISNVVVQTLLNVIISVYSFRNGFSIVEYYMFMWIVYLFLFLIQGLIYTRKAHSYISPFMASLISNLVTYLSGILLVDVFPSLFTII